MQIVPAPKSLRLLGGSISVPTLIPILSDFKFESQLQSSLKTFPFLRTTSESRQSCSLRLKWSEADSPGESYRLFIEPNGIRIEAGSEPGIFRGLTSLSQIIKANGQSLPCLLIDDHPDIEVRGYMLDISRCKVPTQESLFQLVDTLSSLKFNQLQLYTEHTFAYRDHQAVWGEASPLTAAEIQALDTYCFHRYIELVPNQNSFGHMDRWLRNDTYKHLAECPNGYEHPISGPLPWGGTLKPNQASLDFVAELYDELLPNFRSSLFNIGGDEPWELGQGWSRDKVKAKGKHRVYLDHLRSIQSLVASREKTMQFWGDIILEAPELAKELPQDSTGIIWGYEADHPFESQCATFQASGIPFYVAPGTAAWNTICGRQKNAFTNIKEATRQAIRHEAKGILLTDWGDFGHHHFPPVSYPAIIWAATLSWNQESDTQYSYIQTINTVFFEDQSPDLAKAISNLSNLANVFTCQPINRTLLNDLLFTTGKEFLRNLSKTNIEELAKCRIEILEILDSLMQIDAHTGNAAQAKQELILTGKLLHFAVEKSLSELNQESGKRELLNTELKFLIEVYRERWLERNRPGGLDESVSYLEKSLE